MMIIQNIFNTIYVGHKTVLNTTSCTENPGTEGTIYSPTHKGYLISKHYTTSMTGHVYKTRESRPNNSELILKSPRSQSSHFILTFSSILHSKFLTLENRGPRFSVLASRTLQQKVQSSVFTTTRVNLPYPTKTPSSLTDEPSVK